MAFKKIWNELKTDVLREELWNGLTDEEKHGLYYEHSEHQRNSSIKKLTPDLRDQEDKLYDEYLRLRKIKIKLLTEGIRGSPKYSKIPELPMLYQVFDALKKISHYYSTSIIYIIIFQKSVGLTPQEIIDLELKYFWTENESLEKQKKDWDIRIGKFTPDGFKREETLRQYSTGEVLTDPLPATENDVAMEFRDRFLSGFDENEQEHSS